MTRLAYVGLALGALTVSAAGSGKPPAAAAAGFSVRYRNVSSPERVRALTVLPGETVTFEVVNRGPGSGYVARPAAGRLVPLGTERWAWTAPPVPGLYPIQVTALNGGDSVTLQAFVVVPYDRLQGGELRVAKPEPHVLPRVPHDRRQEREAKDGDEETTLRET